MIDDKKQIEEMANLLGYVCRNRLDCDKDGCYFCTARILYNQGYRKIPEGAVVISKEVSCYENIEKRVKTFRFDGESIDFTDEQIMALYQIFHIKERNENEIRKETAREIFNALGFITYRIQGKAYIFDTKELREIAKQYGVEVEEWTIRKSMKLNV